MRTTKWLVLSRLPVVCGTVDHRGAGQDESGGASELPCDCSAVGARTGLRPPAQGVFALFVTVIPITRLRVAQVWVFVPSDQVGLIMI